MLVRTQLAPQFMKKWKVKLCDLVAPVYVCEACGFRECQACWDKRHNSFVEHHFSSGNVCAATKVRCLPSERNGVAYWEVDKDLR